MSKISFTPEAVRRLQDARDRLRSRRDDIEQATPLLCRSNRTIVRPLDGEAYELGPRLHLDSRDASETQDDAVLVTVNDGLQVALFPVSFFGTGEHRIGFSGGEFCMDA